MSHTANILADGTEHRTYDTGAQSWWKDGVMHRLDGPALIVPDNGTVPTIARTEWYRHGVLHRADGPAVEFARGRREWFIEGKRHRLDGPAVEVDGDEVEHFKNGIREYWEFGVHLKEQDEVG